MKRLGLFLSIVLTLVVIGRSHGQSIFLPALSGGSANVVELQVLDTTVPINLSVTSTGLTITPNHGKAGDVVTIQGSGLSSAVAVLFGQTPSQFSIQNDTTILSIVPQGAQNGLISVISLVSSGTPFTIDVIQPTLDPPTATSVPPTATSPPTVAPTATSTSTPVPTSTSTATATAVPPTATTVPATSTPVPAGSGIWISRDEILALPTSGAGWTELIAAADKTDIGSPSLTNQDSDHSTYTMAQALVCARTGIQSYCQRVVTTLNALATGNYESGTRALALGRELIGYILSADIVDLKTINPSVDGLFRTKIRSLLTFPTKDGPDSLISCDERRANNWGGHCGASRIAADLYLGDRVDLDKAANVLRGWMGDRSAYAGFVYDQPYWQDWQPDPSKPVGILPPGAQLIGRDFGGAEPEEMRRAGVPQWPPSKTDYAWEGLQGRLASTWMLHRAGYDVANVMQKAMLRAVQFLYSIGWPAVGDDQWQIPLINRLYNVAFPVTGGGKGKNVGWTLWAFGQ